MTSITLLNKQLKRIFLILGVSMLVACGGGSDEEDVAKSGDGEGGIIGTAKIVVKSSEVKAKAKSGNSYTAAIGDKGKFSFKSSKLKTDTYLLNTKSGSTNLYSIAYVTKGTTRRSNVHPLTDLIIRNWFATQDLDIDKAFKGNDPISKLPTLDEVNAIEKAIEGIVTQLLKDSGLAAGVNLISEVFEVSDKDKFNQFLEMNKVVINNNHVTLVFGTGNQIQGISIDNININTDFTKDNENPSIPASLRALAASQTEIVVVWEASTDNRGIAGYHIYRDGRKVATTPYPVFTDKNLNKNTPYVYEVEAIDGAGNISGKTAITDQVTTLNSNDITPPPAINSLSVTANGDDIDLTWNITQVNDIARFIVKRGVKYVAKSNIASITSTTFNDFNLADGNYCYSVVAVDAAGNKSDESAEQCDFINTGGTVQTPSITCNSYSDLPYKNINQDTIITAGCYTVKSTVTVTNPAKLTIKPGVKLLFTAGTKLLVRSGASMHIVGTKNQPIIITAKDPTPGYWDGIEYYETNSSSNKLEHVVVEYGKTNLLVSGSTSYPSRISVKNSTLQHALYAGFHFETGAIINTFSQVTSTKNLRPGKLPANLVHFLGNDSSYSGNTDDTVHVYKQTILNDQLWKKLNVPYYLNDTGNYSIQAHLTIDAGARLIFNTGGQLYVYGYQGGKLTAIGTANAPIIFTGKEPLAGYWGGINYYETNSASNRLEHVVVEYGKTNLLVSGSTSYPSRISVKNSTLQHALYAGFHFETGAVIEAFSKVISTNNLRPGKLPANLVHLIGSDSNYSGNTDDSVHVYKQTITNDQTWKQLNVPYYLTDTGNYTLHAHLTISAGTKLIFGSGSHLNVYGYQGGKLTAIGTESSPIIFTGKEQEAGSWKGITFYETISAINKLEHTVIEYAGGGGLPENSANITMSCSPNYPSILILKNSTVRHSAGWGVNSGNNSGCRFTNEGNDISLNVEGNIK